MVKTSYLSDKSKIIQDDFRSVRRAIADGAANSARQRHWSGNGTRGENYFRRIRFFKRLE
ncbi:MAG: hypothetical protein B6245_20680 [Desulfobacteraceae bacterium 4572_88]|nr:MAG: hypothetical protein B6245_20680 [Desulfobacteraceae bacterium 4572_88]